MSITNAFTKQQFETQMPLYFDCLKEQQKRLRVLLEYLLDLKFKNIHDYKEYVSQHVEQILIENDQVIVLHRSNDQIDFLYFSSLFRLEISSLTKQPYLNWQVDFSPLCPRLRKKYKKHFKR